MPVLSALVPTSAWSALRDAWRWWVSELRAMLPTELGLRRQPAPYSDIWISSGGITIERVRGGTGERLAHDLPIEAIDDEGWAELRTLIEGTRSRLLLSPPEVYSAVITLPAAARRRLSSAVALQLGQVAPIEPALLVWSSELLSSTRTDLSVLVVMARRSRIEAIEQLFLARDLPVPPVFAAVEQGAIRLTGGFDGARGSHWVRDRRAWLFAAMLLASIPFTTLLGARLMTGLAESRIAAIQQELAPRIEAERRAARAEQLRRALAPLFAQPSATDAIENLALGLPDTAYATEMERGLDDSLHFTIDAADADSVNGALSKTALLRHAETADMAPGEGGRIRISYRSGG